eukprot:645969-Prorocentrum_minimum.AAC.1
MHAVSDKTQRIRQSRLIKQIWSNDGNPGVCYSQRILGHKHGLKASTPPFELDSGRFTMEVLACYVALLKTAPVLVLHIHDRVIVDTDKRMQYARPVTK